MRRKAILVFWLFGILFPMGWLAHLNTHTRTLFEALFQPQWTHVFMHMVLYGMLAFMLAAQLSRRGRSVSTRRIVVATLAAAAAVAIAQECIQLFYQSRLPRGDEVFDVAVDVAGAAIGIIAYVGVSAKGRLSGVGG